jgi:hypothetical protein
MGSTSRVHTVNQMLGTTWTARNGTITGVRVNFKVPPPDPICRRCLRSGSVVVSFASSSCVPYNDHNRDPR